MVATDWLVILEIASRRVAATVALRDGDNSERVKAHKVVHCDWLGLSAAGRQHAIAEALGAACRAADIEAYSVFVAVSDAKLRANFAVGYADLEQEMVLREEEVYLALNRAAHQAIGSDRVVLHALPQRWEMRSRAGQRTVDNPLGQTASHLTCHVLLVTAEKAQQRAIAEMLAAIGVDLEALIAQPVALHRGMISSLKKTGTTLIVDCGARHTSLLVHRKQRLVHLETHPFGGDHLTEHIATELQIDLERAEQLKRDLDIGMHADNDHDSGQMYLWREVQERDRMLGPAARVCRDFLQQFFRERAKALGESDALGRQAQVRLVGRAAALSGLASLLKDVFKLPVELGSGHKERDPSVELADLTTLGLVRTAATVRERLLRERDLSGIHKMRRAATGLWAWLLEPLR